MQRYTRTEEPLVIVSGFVYMKSESELTHTLSHTHKLSPSVFCDIVTALVRSQWFSWVVFYLFLSGLTFLTHFSPPDHHLLYETHSKLFSQYWYTKVCTGKLLNSVQVIWGFPNLLVSELNETEAMLFFCHCKKWQKKVTWKQEIITVGTKIHHLSLNKQ